jgi:hypothetical protein
MMSACDTLPRHEHTEVDIPFIAKPFHFEVLAMRVRELLDDGVSTRPSVVRS